MMRLSKSKLGDYNNCPRKFYLGNFTIHGKQRPEYEPSYLADGKYLHEYYERFNNGDGSHLEMEIYSEFIQKNISNFHKLLSEYGLHSFATEQKFYDPELDLVGIVDWIAEKDGKFYIIDYKTGKASAKKDEKLYELYLYAYLVKKFLEIDPDFVGMWFTQFPEESFVEKFSKTKYEKYMNKYHENRQNIMDLKFNRIENALCPWCNFINICHTYKDDIVD